MLTSIFKSTDLRDSDHSHAFTYIDVLKALATFLVVLIHVVAPYLYQFSHHHIWSLTNFLDSIARPAVPLFLMVSGALLLSNEKLDESKKNFFIKRVRRLLIPCVTWILFYFGWRACRGNIFSFHEVVVDLVQGTAYYHIPFLYYLIGIYLITPLLRLFVRSATNSDLVYALAIWFVSVCIIPLSSKFFQVSVSVPLTVAGGLIGYFLLGHYLSVCKIPKAWILVLTFLVGFFITDAGTLCLTKANGVLDEFFYVYTSVGVVSEAAAYFLICRKLLISSESKNSVWKALVGAISANSFGIYLIHPFVLDLIQQKIKTKSALGDICLSAFCVIVISCLLVYLLKKNRFLARCVT
jgi:surface polysaccharide O-acyltransferase-like enzyme